MSARDTYPELVGMIRRLYEELAAHDRDYHHRTNRGLVHDVREFLVAVGELPAPEPEVEEADDASEPDEEEQTEPVKGGESE